MNAKDDQAASRALLTATAPIPYLAKALQGNHPELTSLTRPDWFKLASAFLDWRDPENRPRLDREDYYLLELIVADEELYDYH